MSKLTKPDYSIRWAQTGVVTPPDDTKKQTGWVVEKPAYDYMNWLQLRQDTGIAYMLQMGIPEWDSSTEYQHDTTYESYVQKGGIVYKAIATNTNKDPATQTAYWTRAFDDYGVAATVQTNLSAHITNYGTLASLSNVATARSNLSVYSKSETDAKYALLAGSGSQTFSVATASSSNHAVPKAQMDSALAAYQPLPPGVIVPFGGTPVPSGWLACNGSAVSRTTYSSLFAAIGTLHGTGDGSTTFNLPDLRGEFIRGLDQGRGVDVGRVLGSSQTDQMKSITFSTASVSQTGSSFVISPKDLTIGSEEIHPRNIALIYIIKI